VRVCGVSKVAVMARKSDRESVVKRGGIAREPANAEDVTRDTYGDSQPAPVGKDTDRRVAEADRTAAAAGIPGVAVPEPESAPEAAEEQQLTTAETSDRVASRQDVERLTKNRE
jgi:hypothetical protein